MNSEKVSFNMSVVDLGKIHMLVEKGVYINRSDFIKRAIQNELLRNNETINKVTEKNDFSLGIIHYSRQDLERVIEDNKSLSIFSIGLIVFAKDIDLALAQAAISEIKVYGKFVASKEIKDYFDQQIK